MLSTEKAFDILPFISDIYEKIDLKDFIETYKEKNKDKNKNENKALRQTIAGLDLFSFVMKQSGKVKEEFFNIVAIAEDKKVEDVKKQSFVLTLKTIKELFTDKELNDFFKQAMQ